VFRGGHTSVFENLERVSKFMPYRSDHLDVAAFARIDFYPEQAIRTSRLDLKKKAGLEGTGAAAFVDLHQAVSFVDCPHDFPKCRRLLDPLIQQAPQRHALGPYP